MQIVALDPWMTLAKLETKIERTYSYGSGRTSSSSWGYWPGVLVVIIIGGCVKGCIYCMCYGNNNQDQANPTPASSTLPG